MADAEKTWIVGVGDDGLEGLAASARSRVEQAELLVGSERTLGLIADTGAERLVVGANLDVAVERLGGNGQRAVVLAYGDPLFYGLARYLCERLGKERFEVVPNVSSMQLAFARVMESWEDAYLTNLANHPLESAIDKIRTSEKVGLFTSDEVTPSALATALLQRGIDYFQAYVCENLGSPDERVTRGTLEEIRGQSFAPLNVMILIRAAHAPDRPSEAVGLRLFGNPEDTFAQSKPKHGLLTPAEVRALALAQMDLGRGSIVWDVGAGCGSVSIEAAQLAPAGRTFAIERDAEEYALIDQNARRFGVDNVTPVLGSAPEAWADLPDPDAVFIEGSGREVCRIAQLAYARLRAGGRLVASLGSLDAVDDVHRHLAAHTPHLKVWMINLARSTQQLQQLRFEALNPSFLLAAEKGEGDERMKDEGVTGKDEG